MKKYFEILKKCSLFTDITDENLGTMLACLGARVVNFKKNETIISEGSPAKYVGIILSGSAQITKIDYHGNRSIVAKVEPSDIFGEAFACAQIKSIPVDVTATEDTSVMFIDCVRITHSCTNACEFHRQIIFNLVKTLAMKNILYNQKLEITSKRTTREKLMTYLSLQAKKSSSFTIPFDRQGLADYLEVDRSGLSAEISKLRNEGIIECRKNHFKLL